MKVVMPGSVGTARGVVSPGARRWIESPAATSSPPDPSTAIAMLAPRLGNSTRSTAAPRKRSSPPLVPTQISPSSLSTSGTVMDEPRPSATVNHCPRDQSSCSPAIRRASAASVRNTPRPLTVTHSPPSLANSICLTSVDGRPSRSDTTLGEKGAAARSSIRTGAGAGAVSGSCAHERQDPGTPSGRTPPRPSAIQSRSWPSCAITALRPSGTPVSSKRSALAASRYRRSPELTHRVPWRSRNRYSAPAAG
ncbi:hypothetical protein FUT87_10105 [Mitsuaria sp. TWR114]|uniref:hypothetical protein n=1 Tax=Mitsuaria sp. TWR114 TaxID=2601731 RepID=UPI0011BF2505|nr:hypothetical protein [Mitsuaria sp. TWR114]TXD91513.1 hypothetical protein FUT87_10105 [Mitsuaria sp. TWR114]